MSEFRFAAKDGIHVHTYLEKAQISVFSLLDTKGNLISMVPAHCEKEEYHVRRVQNDFNQNNLTIPDQSKNFMMGLWKESKIKFFVTALLSILLIPMIVVFSMTKLKATNYE